MYTFIFKWISTCEHLCLSLCLLLYLPPPLCLSLSCSLPLLSLLSLSFSLTHFAGSLFTLGMYRKHFTRHMIRFICTKQMASSPLKASRHDCGEWMENVFAKLIGAPLSHWNRIDFGYEMEIYLHSPSLMLTLTLAMRIRNSYYFYVYNAIISHFIFQNKHSLALIYSIVYFWAGDCLFSPFRSLLRLSRLLSLGGLVDRPQG